ncbi:hypothetical protein GQ42DRAFT_123157 [Ramicandelaber brevisporus]|nr:hypothetical protein GQ42DRAFT_123157 [Ramicandelaber brevisporus]
MDIDTDETTPAATTTASATAAAATAVAATTTTATATAATKSETKARKEASNRYQTEEAVFLTVLTLQQLLDAKELHHARSLSSSVLGFISKQTRRMLDPIAARVVYFYSRAFELSGRLAETRPDLHGVLRLATLHHFNELQATVINALLRSYLQSDLVEQAARLIAKTTYPEGVSTAQVARYMYYKGRTLAIQLAYTDADNNLQVALRKAPQPPATIEPSKKLPKSIGFLQTINKLTVIVKLLMGEIPERTIFLQPALRTSLAPYLEITRAVRVGDLHQFNHVLSRYGSIFRADGNYTLVLRLRHNVIKAEIRTISLAYSHIPLRDICVRLGLDSEADAEYIVAKAIGDGVIDAVIDHSRGTVRMHEVSDVYSTSEPQRAFNMRIEYCLQLYKDSMRAMRYPGQNKALKGESDEMSGLLERERELMEELTNMSDDDDDMDI